MFEPSQKVACVDDRFPDGIRDIMNALPRKGAVYTVRDVVPALQLNGQMTTGILLVELVNLPNQHGIEPGFAPWRFAEVEEVSEAVKMMEAMVEPTVNPLGRHGSVILLCCPTLALLLCQHTPTTQSL